MKEEERKKKGGKERERGKRKAARVGRPGISTDRLIPSLKKALDGLPKLQQQRTDIVLAKNR